MLVPYLLRIASRRRGSGRARTRCAAGTSPSRPNSAAAAYFNVVWRDLLALTFHDQLPQDTWPDGGSRWFEVVRTLLGQPTTPGGTTWTHAEQETRDDILREALVDARNEITSRWRATRRLGVGQAAQAHADQPDARQVRDRHGGPAVQPRTVRARRRLVDRRTRPLERAEGYTVTAIAVDADGGRPGRLRQVPLDQPDRRVRARVPRRNYTDQTELWARRRDPPVGLHQGSRNEAAASTPSPSAPSG